MSENMTRVAVNGYGVIGRRVVDAVRAMPDIVLVWVADVIRDCRIRTAVGQVWVLGTLQDADLWLGRETTLELMQDLGRPRGDMWAGAVWGDVLAVQGNEGFLTYQFHNEAIAVPEAIDAIRALTRLSDGQTSMAMTDQALSGHAQRARPGSGACVQRRLTTTMTARPPVARDRHSGWAHKETR